MTTVSSALILVALAAFLSSQAERPATVTPASSGSSAPPPSPQSEPAEVTPGTAAGQVVITEEELNREIAENSQSFGPTRSVRAEIDPTGITLRFSAYGLGGAFSARPVAHNGTIELEDARVEGPLGLFLDADELRARLTEELQRRLAAEGATVEAVTLEQDRLVVTVSGA